MKVAITSVQEFNPNIGGIERVSVSLAEALVKTGIEVILVSCRKSPYKVDYQLPIRQFMLPSPEDYAPCNVTEFARIVHTEVVNIILNQNAHSRSFNRFCHEVKTKCGVPLISVFHFCPDMRIRNHQNNIDFRFYTIKQNLKHAAYNLATRWPLTILSMRDQRVLFREMYALSDRVVLLSSQYDDDFLSIGGIKEHTKLYAIPNMLSFGISTDSCKKEKRILFCARFQQQKRPYRALYVWQELQDRLADWHLDMVGDGPYLARCKALAGELGLQRVLFHGFQDPVEFYKQSSVFWLTSNYEGWGLTLNEAMQFGCVPVAFHSFKSITDIVEDGVNGLLVKAFDINAFSQATASLIESGRLKPFSEAARVSVSRFLPDKIVMLWRDLFAEVLHEN